MRRFLSLFLVSALVCSLFAFASAAEEGPFSDVPADSWSAPYIQTLKDLQIVSGMGDNQFGPGLNVKRSEFARMLTTLMGWDLVTPQGRFSDCAVNAWYTPYVETALQNGAVLSGEPFAPEEYITRADMAVMLIRALGYDELASAAVIRTAGTPFTDIPSNYNLVLGHIILATDFGIIQGTTPTTFDPDGLATREQAAAMMVRLYDKWYKDIENLHGFYAFSSFSQSGVLPYLDSMSGGWSKLEYWNSKGGAYLNQTKDNGNSWVYPETPEPILSLIRQCNIPCNLTVFMDHSQKVTVEGEEQRDAQLILNDPAQRAQAISLITTELKNAAVPYSGVVIDFEGFTSADYRASYVQFLNELKPELQKIDKSLLVAVPPIGVPGQDYYQGYDWEGIGAVADTVILMAHDYEVLTLPAYEMDKGDPKTPLTPADKVAYALRSIVTKIPPEKLMLQLNFDTARWELKDGKVINSSVLRSDAPSIYARLQNPGTTYSYNTYYQNPVITYYDDSDGTDNVLWYEDERSMEFKVRLARMYGINQISVWRIGAIPSYDGFNIWGKLFGLSGQSEAKNLTFPLVKSEN